MILITGASGFIGSHLRDKLGDARLVSRKKIIGRNTFIINSLDSFVDWSLALEGVDCIVHLASVAHRSASLDELNEVNVLATTNLAIQAAKSGVKKIVYLSSIGVNGSNTQYGQTFSNLSDTAPWNPYSMSKMVAEKQLSAICLTNNIELAILRPPLVYGKAAPGNYSLLLKLIKKVRFLPFGLCDNKRSFISVYNLVDLIVFLCQTKNDVAGVFLPSDNEDVSTKQFLRAVSTSFSRKIIMVPMPKSLMKTIFSMAGKKNLYFQLFGDLVIEDLELVKLGWAPKYSMQQSLSKSK